MKYIRLINNERISNIAKNPKACELDFCVVIDYAQCTVGAKDICKYDYAACWGTQFDGCPGESDYLPNEF